MKNYFKILWIIFPLFCSGTINAQVLEKYVKSKAQVVAKRAFDRTDKKVDTMLIESVDKQMDKQLNKADDEKESENTDTQVSGESGQESSQPAGSSRKSSGYNPFLSKLGGFNAPVDLPAAYNFKGYLLMEMEGWNADGEQENQTQYKTFYSDDAKSFAMEFIEPGKGKSLIIFDNTKKMMVVLSDDGKEKSGMVMPLNTYGSDSLTTEVETEQTESNTETKTEEVDYSYYNTSYKKTGNSKNIAGYNCEEYAYESEEEILSFWVTNELPADLYSRIFSLNTFASVAYTGVNQGFTMEWDFKKKTSKERTKMVVKEVDKNKPSTISTTGYNLINLGNYQPE